MASFGLRRSVTWTKIVYNIAFGKISSRLANFFVTMICYCYFDTGPLLMENDNRANFFYKIIYSSKMFFTQINAECLVSLIFKITYMIVLKFSRMSECFNCSFIPVRLQKFVVLAEL